MCKSPLQEASKRRILSSESCPELYEFFFDVVAPGHQVAVGHYVCRQPCFANLVKARRHKLALQSLIGSLRSSLHATSKQVRMCAIAGVN